MHVITLPYTVYESAFENGCVLMYVHREVINNAALEGMEYYCLHMDMR